VLTCAYPGNAGSSSGVRNPSNSQRPPMELFDKNASIDAASIWEASTRVSGVKKNKFRSPIKNPFRSDFHPNRKRNWNAAVKERIMGVNFAMPASRLLRLQQGAVVPNIQRFLSQHKLVSAEIHGRCEPAFQFAIP